MNSETGSVEPLQETLGQETKGLSTKRFSRMFLTVVGMIIALPVILFWFAEVSIPGSASAYLIPRYPSAQTWDISSAISEAGQGTTIDFHDTDSSYQQVFDYYKAELSKQGWILYDIPTYYQPNTCIPTSDVNNVTFRRLNLYLSIRGPYLSNSLGGPQVRGFEITFTTIAPSKNIVPDACLRSSAP